MRAGRRRLTLGRTRGLALGLAAGMALAGGAVPGRAQGLPTDADMGAAVGSIYNLLGLVEHCGDRGFLTAADVGAVRNTLMSAIGPVPVPAGAAELEAKGRRGEVVGPQLVGKMNLNDPAHRERVPAGRRVMLAENAAARRMSERSVCREMREMAAP